MSRPAERGKANAAGSEAEPRPVTVSRRFEAQLHCQPVVKVWRCTETGEAPRGQGATTENIGPYLKEEQRRQPGCPARELCDESLFRDTSLIGANCGARGFLMRCSLSRTTEAPRHRGIHVQSGVGASVSRCSVDVEGGVGVIRHQ